MTTTRASHAKYNASEKGRAREARRRLNPARAESQAAYDASTKGMARAVRGELARARREALALQN